MTSHRWAHALDQPSTHALVEPRRPELWLRRLRARRTVVAVVAVLLVVAVGLRLWLAFGPLGGLDGDEAVHGLMSIRVFRDGELPVFFWDQEYGGTLGVYLDAVPLAVFGPSSASLKASILAMGVAIVVVTGRIARRVTPGAEGAAMVLAALWPMGIMWKASKANSFYTLTALLGLVVWLLVLRVQEQGRQGARRELVGIGLAAGLGWWTSPNIVYFIGPLGLWLLVRGGWQLRWRLTLPVLGFIVGSAPWLVRNLQTGLESLDQPALGGSSTYVTRLEFFFRQGLPFALGLRRPWDAQWMSPTVAAKGLLVVALVGFVVLVVRTRGKASDVWLLAASPFVFAAFSGNWALYEGRYLFFVAAILPVAVARCWLVRPARLVLVAGVATSTVFFLASTTVLRGAVIPDTTAIGEAVRANGYSVAFANYWTAYPLTFTSDEGVTATPAVADVRFPPYVAEVKSGNPAYVFRKQGYETSLAALEASLAGDGVAYRRIEAGEYLAILPERPYVVGTS